MLARRVSLPFALVALALTGRAGAVRAQAIPAGLGGSLSSAPGVPLDVPIVVDMTARVERLGAFVARLSWDPAVLRLDGGMDGTFGALTVAVDSAGLGILRFTGANPAGATGVVVLGIGRFTPLAATATTLTLTMPELYAATTYADLRPSLNITSGQYCSAAGRYGDFNSDGDATSFDALVAVTHAVGLATGPGDITLLDVDGDLATTTRDALGILTFAVGLPTPGFRILQFASGGCSPNPASTLAVLPGTLGTLVPGQQVQLEARADAVGQPQSIPNLAWRSSNQAVATVDSLGAALSLAAGTATIWAVRDGIDSAFVTLTVVARRTRHVVDAAAIQASNRLGTAFFPFGRLQDAADFAQAGDTIQVRPGRYGEAVMLGAPVVVLGDTLTNGVRPLIALGDPQTAQPAISVVHFGGAFTLRNMEIADAGYGILVSGPDSVDIENLVTSNVGGGIQLTQNTQSLILRRSRLAGTGSVFGSGVEATSDVRVDTLLVEDSDIGDFSGYGIWQSDFDLITLRRTVLHDASYGLLYAGSGGGGARAAGFDVLIEQSTLRGSNYDGIYLYGFNTLTVRDSRIETAFGDVLTLYDGHAVRLLRDSIIASDYSWINASNFDSLTVDSVVVTLGSYSDGYLFNVPRIQIRDSRFLNVEGSALSAYYGGGLGDTLFVRRSAFEGRASGDGYLIEAQDVHTVIDSSTFANAYTGVEAYGDSSLSVTRSTFTGVDYAIEFYSYANVATTQLTVQGNAFTNTRYPLYASDALIVVDSNTIDGAFQAMQLYSYRDITVTRNRVTRAVNGMYLEGRDSAATIRAHDNVISADGDPFYLYGGFNDSTRVEILRDSVVCTGAEAGQTGIYLRLVDGLAADNAVVGCDYGIFSDNFADSTRADTIRNNTVLLPRNAWAGISMLGNHRGRIVGNTVTGDTTGAMAYGGIHVGRGSGCSANPVCLPVFVVDSNVVQLVSRNGIVLEGGDSIEVVGNTITDVVTIPSSGFEAGVSVYGGSYNRLVHVYGNTIERVRGPAVSAYNYYDSGLVHVDSNRLRQNTIGVYFQDGNVSITRNRITGSSQYAIYRPTFYAGLHTVTGNNLGGNAYGISEAGQGLDALSNWWGDPLGPRCASGCTSVTGDSVSAAVIWNPPLTSEDPVTPPPAPPAMNPVAAPRVVVAGASARAWTPPPARPAGRPAAGQRAPRARSEAVAGRDELAQQRREATTAARAARRAELDRRREAARAERAAPRSRPASPVPSAQRVRP